LSEQHRSKMFCAVLLALAAACGGKQQSPAPPATAESAPDAAPAPVEDCEALGRKVEIDARAKMPRNVSPEATQQMEAMLTAMVGLVVTSCKDDRWSAEAIHCGLTSTQPDAECDQLLSVEQKQKMQDRMMKAMSAFDDSTAPAGSSGIPECDAYVAAMDTYMACDKVPQSARDAARQGIEAMKQGWADADQMPDDIRKMAADSCKQALDAMRQSTDATGCPR
jgi:hypothetical protein